VNLFKLSCFFVFIYIDLWLVYIVGAFNTLVINFTRRSVSLLLQHCHYSCNGRIAAENSAALTVPNLQKWLKMQQS